MGHMFPYIKQPFAQYLPTSLVEIELVAIGLSETTIIHKIFQTNSSFHVAQYRKSLVSVFQEFFASINKIFILAGRLEMFLWN